MRRIYAFVMALGLVGAVGCGNETCDCEKPIYGPCCPRDVCAGCGMGTTVAKPPAEEIKTKPAEEIKTKPMPAPMGGVKPMP